MAECTGGGHLEPMVYPGRPSLAGSQSTTHTINACFEEILATELLDKKDTHNLKIVKKLESASTFEFQQYYVKQLNKVRLITLSHLNLYLFVYLFVFFLLISSVYFLKRSQMNVASVWKSSQKLSPTSCRQEPRHCLKMKRTKWI